MSTRDQGPIALEPEEQGPGRGRGVHSEPALRDVDMTDPEAETAWFAEVEFRMLGLDPLWKEAHPGPPDPFSDFPPPRDEHQRAKHAEFIRRLPVHEALLVFPRAAAGYAPEECAGWSPDVDFWVSVARVDGDWWLVGGRYVRGRRSAHDDEPLRIHVHEGDVVPWVARGARTSLHGLGAGAGAYLLAAVKLYLLHLREQGAPAPPISGAAVVTSAACAQGTRDICRSMRVKVQAMKAAAFVYEHGCPELCAAVFADEGGMDPVVARRLALLPTGTQRQLAEAHFARAGAVSP